MAFGTAVQVGNQIIITSQSGGITRVYDGRLLSYINGYLTYVNGGRIQTYVGI